MDQPRHGPSEAILDPTGPDSIGPDGRSERYSHNRPSPPNDPNHPGLQEIARELELVRFKCTTNSQHYPPYIQVLGKNGAGKYTGLFVCMSSDGVYKVGPNFGELPPDEYETTSAVLDEVCRQLGITRVTPSEGGLGVSMGALLGVLHTRVSRLEGLRRGGLLLNPPSARRA